MDGKTQRPPRRGARAPQTVGSVIGTVLGVVLIVGGLAVVGTAVLLVMALNQLASNK